MFELIKKLAGISGVSGDESRIADAIEAYARPYADEIKRDTLGNLIVHKKGEGKRIMFCAHMDTIGIIATYVEKEGYVRFSPVGGISPYTLADRAVVFSNGVHGVITKEDSVKFKDLKMSDLYVDVGDSRVSVGDTATFYGETVMLDNDKICSPYLDNRACCAIMLRALENLKDIKNDCYFVFTSQEEVGLRGAYTSTYEVEPEFVYAVDVTLTGDVIKPEYKSDLKLGGGAGIKIMDDSVIASKRAVDLAVECAKERGILTQLDIITGGGTDAGAAQSVKGGAYTGGISLPVRYIHTPVETANFKDADECVRLICAICQKEL